MVTKDKPVSPLSISDEQRPSPYFTGYFNTTYTLRQAEATHELNQQSAFSQYIISTLHWSYALPFPHLKLSKTTICCTQALWANIFKKNKIAHSKTEIRKTEVSGMDTCSLMCLLFNEYRMMSQNQISLF